MCFGKLSSPLGRKAVMAVTGLLLYGFVVVHMLGNLQIFLGAEALNTYAEHILELGPLLWVARGTLLVIFLTHIITAFSLAVENRRARPIGYKDEDTIQASLASRTMVITGILILCFVIFHLLHFTFDKIHPEFAGLTDASGRDDVYSMVVLGFRDPVITCIYILAMFVLATHLGHGIQSSLQSLGLCGPERSKKVIGLSHLGALVIFVGNSSIALSCLFGFIRPL